MKKKIGKKLSNIQDSKNLIVYDLETSGINSAFSSILQVAAICVDSEFNEIGRIDLRGKMKKFWPIPNPKSLLINGVSIEQLKNHENSNFSLISQIQNQFLSWGESIYIGYNSIGFDEHHLRQGLYQSAFHPYLTNTGGNSRGDALKLVHTAAAAYPNAFVKPISEETGKLTFQLEKFAKANNIKQEKAHDALSDVEATLDVCKLIKDRCSDVWLSSQKTLSKSDVYSFMNRDQAFCSTRYYRGFQYTNGIVYLTKNPAYENHIYAFDLKHDPEYIFDLDREELKALFKGKDKCFHLIKANEFPILLDEKYLYQSKEYKNIKPEEISKRVKQIRSNKTFAEKFENLLFDIQSDKELSTDQSPKLIEDQIYNGFPDKKDKYLMNEFHAASPDKKYEIAEKISDLRIKEFAIRIIFSEFEDCMPKKEVIKRNRLIAENHLTLDEKPWCTIPQAMLAIDNLRENEEDVDLERLDEIDEFLQEKEANFKKYL